ncbi:hypothetical protein [Streptomyces sp. NPDC056361]|uniref:hypothetical protein n=1 Tax=Streptomyces sp. NPDC056361 TaxID=3345795 RepID=UPI0035D5CE36
MTWRATAGPREHDAHAHATVMGAGAGTPTATKTAARRRGGEDRIRTLRRDDRDVALPPLTLLSRYGKAS